jgi:hypothetical protein
VLIALLAGVAMFVGDVLQGMYVVLLNRGRSALAGAFDGLADLTEVLSIGGGAAAVFVHPHLWTAAATFALIFLGSVAGAIVGDKLSARLTGKPPVTESRIH